MSNTFDGLVSGTSKPPKRTIKRIFNPVPNPVPVAQVGPTTRVTKRASAGRAIANAEKSMGAAVERAKMARAPSAFTISAIHRAARTGEKLAGHAVDASDLAAAQLILLQKTAPAYLKLKPDAWRDFDPDDLHHTSPGEGRAYGTRAATELLPLADVLRLGDEIRRVAQAVTA